MLICKLCNFSTKHNCDWYKHIKTKKHEKRHNVPKLQKCTLCQYYTYYNRNMTDHKRYHRERDVKVNKIRVISTLEEPRVLDIPQFVGTQDELKKKIGEILKKCKKYQINPNKYFNYKYYALNVDKLSILEWNDFYLELMTTIQ